ncbi:MAG: class I SAM-dependent RNA methyltransferase [Caulobacteraceae bacterium]
MARQRQGSTAKLETFTIEAVGAQGDGVAAGPVHIPLTLPGETVTALRQGQRAELQDIVTASPDRRDPPCRHFGVCGGCALQHWEMNAYLAWKQDQVRRVLARERLETEIAPIIATPAGSRRRLALHARAVKGGAAVGFKERRSWALAPISECPIADPKLVAALPELAKLARPFLEHPKSAPTLHVTLTETGLDIDVTGVERKSGGLSADARMRAAEAAQGADFARVTLAGEIVYQARTPRVRVGPASVALPPGSFLQAAAQAEVAMAELVLEGVKGAERLADLFCGVGAFTFRLAGQGTVLAMDSAAEAIAALKGAISSAPGLKGITAEARDLERRPLLAEDLKKIEAVVFDPPRAGAAEQARQIAKSAAPVAVAVSCNPATFARDARLLVDGGFVLEKVTPVDQFLWSPHIELVAVFRR